jgi:S1-C subfamily serine protease
MSDINSRPIQGAVRRPTSGPAATPGTLWEPLIAVILAAAWLGFLMWPGVVLFPARIVPPQSSEVLPENLPSAPAPATSPQAAPASPATSPSPRADAPPAGGPTTARLQAGALSDRLDSSVVMIAGTDASGKPGGGTGFFVAPTFIVTNRHVIAGLDPNSLKVASKRLQPSQRPRIVAESSDGAPTQARDLALLSVDQASSGFLKLGPSPSKLTPIVAVGYPEYLLDADSVISQGLINQKPESLPVKLLTHSAKIGKGGAGGPIVDLCGRVVGVNTAAANEGGGGDASAILAQDVTELAAFLSANHVAITADDAACPGDLAVAPAPPGR